MFCIQGYSRQCKNCKLIEAKTIHGQAVTFCYIWGKTLMNEEKPRTGLGLMRWERHRSLRFKGIVQNNPKSQIHQKQKKKSWGQGWGWWDGSTAGARAITFSTQLGQSQPCTQLAQPFAIKSKMRSVKKYFSSDDLLWKKNQLCLIRSRSGQICHYLCIYLFFTVFNKIVNWATLIL